MEKRGPRRGLGTWGSTLAGVGSGTWFRGGCFALNSRYWGAGHSMTTRCQCWRRILHLVFLHSLVPADMVVWEKFGMVVLPSNSLGCVAGSENHISRTLHWIWKMRGGRTVGSLKVNNILKEQLLFQKWTFLAGGQFWKPKGTGTFKKIIDRLLVID